MSENYGAGPENGTQSKVWIRSDYNAWLEREAERRHRSKGWLINEAIGQRMQRLEKGRQRSQRGRAGRSELGARDERTAPGRQTNEATNQETER